MQKYDNIRETLNDFYFGQLPELVENTRAKVFDIMDEYDRCNPGKSSFQLKAKLYETIAACIEPVVFENISFFFETGALTAYSDGQHKRAGVLAANGWLIENRGTLCKEADPDTWSLMRKNVNAGLFVQGGLYVDLRHIGIPFKKCFEIGLKGIYAELEAELAKCETETETEFITCAMVGIKALHTIQLKFSEAARKKGMNELADIAQNVPWEKPDTFYEGLITFAFIRKALGAIEGVGFSSFGRVDRILDKLYKQDINNGVSYEEMFDKVSEFILIWDCTLDRSKKMGIAAEYELENSLTLGGCDDEGNPFYNGVTELFIEARDSLSALYPKMMLRFSKDSDEEYLKLISKSMLDGKNLSIYINDDTLIPALIKSGIEVKDARNYTVGGCWDAILPDLANKFSGEFLNILKPLEWSVHNCIDKMEENQLYFNGLDECTSFEELYQKYLGFVEQVLYRKAEPMSRLSKLWHKINPVCALSALMEPCIQKRTDLTAGSGKYNRESIYFTCFAETVDSLLVIKHLCFDEKKYTLNELFEQCRSNWQDEILRRRIINKIPSFGDGSEETSLFAARLNDDLNEIASKMPTAYGGKFRTGYNLYTEIVRWGKEISATPNGRKHGDVVSQGITPSRLQKPLSAADIFDSFRYLDITKCAGNSSMSVVLPAGKITLEKLVHFFKMAANSNIQSVQPNVLSRDELLKAQKEPEKYSHIIVRVAGFSAPFVLLSTELQNEVISRNFAEI